MDAQLQKQKPEGTEVKKPNLTGIPTQMKLDFERRSGLSFDDVRVHYNSDKPARLGALAYTQGTQVHVGPGQERSLPHELGHVIQQKAGRVRPTRWIGGLPVNDQPELEHEADLAPVQRMPAPGLWGVVQMDLPRMPHQRGNNCGYHALARAILKFQENGTVTLPYTKNNLEMYLTSYAMQEGFSVIGEAFDPLALAHVGTKFCEQNGINATCTLISYRSSDELRGILNNSHSDGSVILVPYYPDLNTMNVTQNDPRSPQENAHWSAIDTDSIGSYKLYEGNYHGSTGLSKATGPVPVTPDGLAASNQSILPQFNWNKFVFNTGYSSYFQSEEAIEQAVQNLTTDYNTFCLRNNCLEYMDLFKYKKAFILSSYGRQAVWNSNPYLCNLIITAGLPYINNKKAAVLDPNDDFTDRPSFEGRIQTVIGKINSIPRQPNFPGPLSFNATNGIQSVSLTGFAVKVQQKT